MNEASAIHRFVQEKIALLDDRGSYSRAMCARLRRAVGKPPGAVPDIWEITLMDMPEEWYNGNGIASESEWSIHTALTLYAMHRQGTENSMNKEGESFGRALAELLRRDIKREDSLRRRFNALATSVDLTELSHHARGMISLLKNESIPMDYPCFAQDLFWFQMAGSADRVRLRWGKDFYSYSQKGKMEEVDAAN